MPEEIATINLTGENCYLIKSLESCLLIDTGYPGKRNFLEKKLNELGCRPGKLKLVILTHGDVDHVANAAYLREIFGAKIAMHPEDVGMIERGDMSVNRKAKPDKMSLVFKVLSSVMSLSVKPCNLAVIKTDLTIDENFTCLNIGSTPE